MTSRTGIPTVIKVAKAFCRTLRVLGPLIVTVTDENPAVVTALNTAETACEALELVLQEYREVGS